MIKVNIEQGSEAWFAERCGRITATRIAIMMSGEATKGYKDLVADLAGEIITGEVEESYSNAIMERGTELEPYARELYCQIFNIEVEEVGFIVHEKYPEWMGVSPDGLPNGGGLEIKCPLRKTHIGYIEKNILPNEYKWQIQGSLFTTGLPHWDFMSYYPNMKPFILRVYPDLRMHSEIETRLLKTIELIKEKINNYNLYDHLK
ncbi:MAG: YqaJ viral recombinase family protein [Bacteroidetes bacterium]|nr:YqaJ viral recombinase family protein [Bacteroidota bacterium]